MIILDTNVLSALMLRDPAAVVVAWLDAQPAYSIWTSAITVFEIEYGLGLLPAGRKRRALEAAFESALAEDLENRVLPFDLPAARHSAVIAADMRIAGRTGDIRDLQIAGIARARNAAVATRNVKHFVDVCQVLNPWDDQT